MDVLSFAAGLALGRKKGGQPSQRNSIFHDILENKHTVYTAGITDDYSCEIAFWSPPMDNTSWVPSAAGGGYTDGYAGVLEKHINSDNETYYAFYNGRYRRYFTVAVWYKNNKPLYATIVENENCLNYDYRYQFNTVSVSLYSDTPNEYGHLEVIGYQIAAYRDYDNYTIDNVALRAVQKFDPVFGASAPSLFMGRWDVGIVYQVEYSYDRYKSVYENVPIPEYQQYVTKTKIVKDGDRQTKTQTITLTGENSDILMSKYGTFSDLSSSQLYSLVDDISYAISEKAGWKTCPLLILEPED